MKVVPHQAKCISVKDMKTMLLKFIYEIFIVFSVIEKFFKIIPTVINMIIFVGLKFNHPKNSFGC